MNGSKGKRGKRSSKRKRSVEEKPSDSAIKKPGPEALDFVTIGYNTTTRQLEALAQGGRGTPFLGLTTPDSGMGHDSNPSSKSVMLERLVAVFVPRSEQQPVLHSHLPILIEAASLASPSLPSIRLVALPSGAEAQLSKALGIPRVGLVGLRNDAPAASDLVEFSRAHVPAVETCWLRDSLAGVYLPTTIKTVHTTGFVESKRNGGTENPGSARKIPKPVS